MGYTHYLTIPLDQTVSPEVWAELINDAKKIVGAAGVEVCDGVGRQGSHPTIDVENGISLNGSEVEDAGHETFELKRDSHDFSFCKTARKPYDVVVTCILLRAYNLAPHIYRVSSDGFWSEWKPARDLYRKLWPNEEIRRPLDDDELTEV